MKYIIILLLCLFTFIACQEVPSQNSDLKKNKYNSYKKLAEFNSAETLILDVLGVGEIKIKIVSGQFDDGTPNRTYQADTSQIQLVGKPDVKEGSVMFVPSKRLDQNSAVILMIGAASRSLCKTEGDQFVILMREITSFLTITERVKQTSAGGCNIELSKISKDIPLCVVAFTAK